MKPTREEIAAIIKAEEEKKSPLVEAINEFSESLMVLRNEWLAKNPGQEKEFEEAFNEFLNHPDNPLKKIQIANFKP